MATDPDQITIGQIEQAGAGPAEHWHGRCYEIACYAAGLLSPECHAVYGHYLGFVDPEGHWRDRAGAPFIQHGWVALPGGNVLDPTRWSFEDADPYVFIAEGGDDYDEGGNFWRAAVMRPPPKRHEQIGRGLKSRREHTVSGLSCYVAQTIATLIGPTEMTVHPGTGSYDWSVTVTGDQAFWLGNAPYDALAPHAYAIYEVVARSYGSAAIPIDNQRRAEREAHKPNGSLTAIG